MSEELKTKTATEGDAVTDITIPADLQEKLAEYGADNDTMKKIVCDLGVEGLDDLTSMEVEDLVGAGMKLAKARKLLSAMKTPAKPAAATVPSAVETRAIQNQFEALLPAIPTDESWLNALKTGGILKVDESSYIAAIRAALADRAGLYNVPEALSKAMEKYADETEEQVDPTFYALRKSLTRRTYGDIFAAIDGLDGNFITESRRKEFLGRIRDTLWPAIAESYRTLDAWYQTWRASASDASESADTAKQYSGKSPKPIDGTWWTWNAANGQYEDTGISCELVGPTGNGIESIIQKSGDHMPGSTDVYEIKMTDGTTREISVYNGKNGTGIGDVQGIGFDIELPVGGWINGKVTIHDDRFIASARYKYFVDTYDECRDEVNESKIKPQDITANGYMTFTTEYTPLSTVTINIVRLEVNGSGEPA